MLASATLASMVGVVVQLATAGAAAAQSGAFVDTTSLASRTLGLTVAASGGPRDTLGLLVAVVTRDGPADQAGITSGSRILAINGQAVRLEPNEIGQRAAADTAMTRFERAVRANASGTDVTLRVIGGGRTRTVSLPMRMSAPAQPTDSVAPRSPYGLQAATPSSPVTAVGSAASIAPAAVSPGVAEAMPAASSTSSTTPTAVNATAVPTLDSLATRLGDLQLDVRRAARESRTIAMSDSLSDIDQAIAQIRRRLRALTPDSVTPVPSEAMTARPVSPATTTTRGMTSPATPAPVTATPSTTQSVPAPAPASEIARRSDGDAAKVSSPVTSARTTVSGLELARVSTDLAAYLGGVADSGLQVVRASEEWEPMRAGDIVLQMDGAAPDPVRLRNAYDAHAAIRLLVLRRGRTFTLSFGEGAAR